MALVDLGTSDLVLGQGYYIYDPFDYRQRDAYAIYATFNSSNFSNVFSFIRIYGYITPTGELPRLVSHYIDLEVWALPQLFYFPMSSLFDGNGTIEFYVERRSFYAGGRDGVDISLNLAYDDQISTPTWR